LLLRGRGRGGDLGKVKRRDGEKRRIPWEARELIEGEVIGHVYVGCVDWYGKM
jgi:hypothetical protein